MKRGRPRKFHPSIPAHIDQHRIPKGAYWHPKDRYWYTIVPGAKPRSEKLGDARAQLSDLHAAMERLAGVDRTSLGWVLDQFHASDDFRALAAATKHDYEVQRRLVTALSTRAGSLAGVAVDRLAPPAIQRLVDLVAAGTRRDATGALIPTPSKANHLLRYLRRALHWGVARGFCRTNAASGVYQAKERKRRRLPPPEVFRAVLQFATERAARPARSEGSCAPYLPAVMLLGWLCRLRPIETITLNDANLRDDGVQTNRRKGSRDNVVAWSPALRSAVDAALAARARAERQPSARGRPVPIRPEQRPLFPGSAGKSLSKSSLDSAWQRLMHAAIDAGVITAQQRFGLHDLKRKGVTETRGTRADKQQASGHKAEAMLDIYDLDLPVVRPAGE